MAYDTGDKKHVKKRKANKALRREEELIAIKELLRTYGGRAFFWRLMAECHMYDFGFCGDNNMLNHREGARRIGGWVQAEIFEAHPQAYTVMRVEAETRFIKHEKENDDG